MEPVGEQPREFGLLQAHLREQRVAGRRRAVARLRAGVGGDARRRHLAADPIGGGVEPRNFERVQALAQHGLERILPAVLDVERLPEPARAGEPVRREPAVDVVAVPDLVLQRRERLRARVEVGEEPAVALPGVARAAVLVLQRLYGGGERILRRLPAGELRRFLRELLFDFGESLR